MSKITLTRKACTVVDPQPVAHWSPRLYSFLKLLDQHCLSTAQLRHLWRCSPRLLFLYKDQGYVTVIGQQYTGGHPQNLWAITVEGKHQLQALRRNPKCPDYVEPA